MSARARGAGNEQTVAVVDAHVHVWDPYVLTYDWLPEDHPLHRRFDLEQLRPELAAVGIDQVVVVQAANTLEETESLLRLADADPLVAGVVGWVPLLDPAATGRALERLSDHRAFVGVRHLVHEEPDPEWLARPAVRESLGLLAEAGLALDVPAELDRHLELVADLAGALPSLTVVVDHLGKPDIASGTWEPWAGVLADAASKDNVVAKLSGLNTAAAQDWSADDLRPYAEHALTCFGADRVMLGSDWPVLTLAGDYPRVWSAASDLLAHLDDDERAAVLGGTAMRTYRLRDR